MFELRPETSASGPVITGFTPQGFKIGAQRFDSGILLTPDFAQSWEVRDWNGFDVERLFGELAMKRPPEFLLLGSGPTLIHPPALLRRSAQAIGLGLEIMDSRAAARTWGMLRAEGRWIAAALMAIS
jgi:uncharacterized protein